MQLKYEVDNNFSSIFYENLYNLIFSAPRVNSAIMNGNNRRPTNLGRIPPIERNTCAQHEDLIKFVYDSWSKVTQEISRSNGNNTIYYHEKESEVLKNFEPFDLEAFCRKKMGQNAQHS